MTRHPALAHEHPIAMAHRGSMLLWPENTMTSFQEAVDLGYRYLETDLQISRDGTLVTFHDDTLDRTTDGAGLVSDYSMDELRGLDAGYRFEADGDYPYRSAGVRIPTLEEVTTTFPDQVFSLDLKSDGMEEALVATIRRLDLWNRVIVGSFSDARLRRFRSLAERPVATSAGPREVLRFVAAARLRLPLQPGYESFQVPVKQGITIVSPRTVQAAGSAGVPVIVWTINDPAEMRELLDLGVDGIISDRPDLLRNLIEERSRETGSRRSSDA
ncbi:MAG: glycerophosphodiester phosphodiesterase [bacterium]|nr:glycerophosphodiester phosphodiesterase [bacterium]MDE0289941.1 glycerophosphodiester phosphodiesterase [bacterium]MDE0437906.1 glycerophosphodiester phosphodiesterase [bacterium]